MKLLDWDQVLEKLYKIKELSGYDPYNLEHAEIFRTIERCFDEQSEDGWNLKCFVDDKIVPNQFGFLFEESDTVYKHSIVFLDEIMEKAFEKWRHAGVEYNNELIAKILEINHVMTPMYIPSLRYGQDEEGNFVTPPIYICRWVDEVTDERKKLYAEYQKEMKKNAVFRGKETKAFIEWCVFKGKKTKK